MPIEEALATQKKEISKRIKIALLERGMSQVELAALIKEGPQQLNKAINGDTSPNSVRIRKEVYQFLNMKEG